METKSLGLLGNIANNFSREALLLNAVGKINATCYYSADPDGPNTENPYSDPIQRSTASSLFTTKPMLGIPWYLLFLPRPLLLMLPNVDRAALVDLDSKTLRVLSGPEIMLGPILRKPFAVRPTGSDLTVYPSLKFAEYWSLVGQNRKARKSDWLVWMLQRSLYIRSYRMAASVAVQPDPPIISALNRIKVKKSRISRGIPLAVDTQSFYRMTEKSKLLPESVGDDDFLVFMPSRIMMTKSPAHIKTGQWKASDAGIKGFGLFVRKLGKDYARKAWLVIPDRTLSDDIQEAKRLVHELHLTDRTVWVQGVQSQGLARSEMIPLYSGASVTLDDFGIGWFGSVVVEAMACQSPVVTYVTKDVLDYSNNPPLLIAKTPEQISERLMELYKNRSQVSAIGNSSREWVKLHHSEGAVTRSYERLMEDIVAARNSR